MRLLRRQKSLADVVKIDRAKEQPFGHAVKIVLQFSAVSRGVFLRAIVQPIAFDRMQNGYLDRRLSAC